MPINLQAVSEKLKHARKLQELSLSDVSQATGIDPERLEQIEAAQSKPSGDEVLILASFYHHDFRDFLDDARPAPFEKTDILYRRHGNAFSAQDRRAIQEFLYLCEIESMLESDLNISITAFSSTPRGNYFKAHGEEAAQQLRSALGYQENAIPRDVFADFRKIGIHVFRRRLTNPEISGLYIEHPIAGHCVLINYDEDIYRHRFSACHEAAHAIFDSSEAVVLSYQNGSPRYDKDDLKEVRANRFASCYLMPPSLLPNVSTWTTETAVSWAQKLRVSTAALSYALLEAGKINTEVARTIRSVRVSSNEKIDPEAPEHLTELQRNRRRALLERGLSDYYVGLCFEAHQQGLMSAGRLSEALLADHAETREISVLYGRAIRHGT